MKNDSGPDESIMQLAKPDPTPHPPNMKNFLKRFFGQSKTTSDTPPGEGQQGVQTNVEQSAEAAQSLYSSDQPIRSRQEDRFNRSGFATRIADTIAGRNDPSSIVVGLYAPWGDGKTSTLHLMEEALAEHPHIVVVRFNPWHFQSEEQLLKGFFATVAEALGQSLPTMKEKIGRMFKDYGSLLSLASISVGGFIQFKPGDAAKGLGDALSTVALDKLKTRIENLLADSGKRVVVLIDDIDRLDRSETQAIFKLVKLSASFNHTSYVLSFDDEMVAAAIGERYGQGGYEAGRSFLEKIIQVPLHLPPPDQIRLRKMAFDGVDAALTQAGITLSQEQVDAFVRHFVDGLEPRLETPRHAKLYANALTFALPLLKGEAHPVDLMLVEGIRVFYPKLYTAVRDNPEYFLKGRPGDHQQAEAHGQQVTELLNQTLKGVDARETKGVRTGLLEVLFPRLSSMGYGAEWDERWGREQRICSDQYFKRYFTYSVPPGDISDLEVARVLESFGTTDSAHQDATLRGFADRDSFPQLIRKLREREDNVDSAIARPLALAVARNGSLLPRERGPMMSDWTFRQGAILVSRMLKRIPTGQERETLADEVFTNVQPLPFGFECLRWVRHDSGRPEAERVIPTSAEERVSAALADRICTHANETPLHLSFGTDAPALYWLWNNRVGEGAVTAHLRARFEANPNEVDAFLDTYVGEAWGMASGLPHRADFRRDSYDAIAKLIDPEILVANLRQRYGLELDTPEFHHSDDVPLACRIAHQFTYIHQKVREDQTQAALAAEPSTR